MNNKEKRNLLNSLLVNVLDADADGETCYYVIVELTEHVKNVLNELGYDDYFINLHKENHDDKDTFDLCLVAWDFSDWFTGDTFIDKESEG